MSESNTPTNGGDTEEPVEVDSGETGSRKPVEQPVLGGEIKWLDTKEVKASEPEAPIEKPTTFNVGLHRETTRGKLARWLMALLTVTVLTLLLLAGLQRAGIVASDPPIRDIAQVVLTPVVTLTGTALGFYFGASTASEDAKSGEGGSGPAARKPGQLRRFVYWLW